MKPFGYHGDNGQRSKDESGRCRVSLVLVASSADALRGVIDEAHTAFPAVAAEYEIVIVANSATDAARVARSAAAADARVRLVEYSGKLGYGAALRKGLEAATLDLVAFNDPRCSFDCSNLNYLLSFTTQYDVTCSYVTNGGGAVHWRLFGAVYKSLLAVLVGSPSQHDCTVKIFRREQLPSLLPASDNYFASAEMLGEAKLQGLRIAEVGLPPAAQQPPKAKLGWLGGAGTLGPLLRFWWSRVIFPAPDACGKLSGAWFWAAFMLLACLSGALLFGNLSYPLIEPDEGRYAEVSRHMLVSGDWIVPMLHRQPFYDKPPLFYWLVAASFHVFGIGEATARLVPALAACLTILSIYVFGARIVGTRPAFISALALTVTESFVQAGRFVILDSLLTFFVTVALFLAHEAVRGQRLHWRCWIASALCCGLGVLTKGPIALVLTAPPVAAFVWLNRDRACIHVKHWAVYVGSVLCLVAPWYVAIIAKDPMFASHFFIEQNLARFLCRYHEEPPWFYVVWLLVGCAPWSVLVVPLIRFVLRDSARVRALRLQSLGFFTLWGGWVFFFFSMSHSKLATYILPALPAIYMVIGCFVDYLLFHSSLANLYQPARTFVPRLTAVGLAAALILLSLHAWQVGFSSTTLVAAECTLLGSGMIGMLLWGGRVSPKIAWLMCCAAASLLVFEISHHAVPALAQRHATHEAIKKLIRDGHSPVVCFGGDWGSVPFYLGHDKGIFNLSKRSDAEVQDFLSHHPNFVLVVKHKSDLDYFQQKACPDWNFAKVLNVDQYTVAVVRAAEPGFEYVGYMPGSDDTE